jgi:alpha 1,2-mannosyltransferase
MLSRKVWLRYLAALILIGFVYLLVNPIGGASSVKGPSEVDSHSSPLPEGHVCESVQPGHHSNAQTTKPCNPVEDAAPNMKIHSKQHEDFPTQPEVSKVPPAPSPSMEEGKNTRVPDYVRSVLEIYEKHRVNIMKLGNYKNGERAKAKAWDDKYPIYTNEELGEFLQVSENDKEVLTKSHSDTVAKLPEYPSDVYSGTGVVFTAGGRYFPVLLVSLRMLRRVSPKIPVEVFVANHEEYEPEFCEKVLPSMGGKCLILSEIYGEQFFKDFDIHGYQLKIMAIIASSFENVIFLDSDSMPIKNVESVTQQEPYLSTGYIIWPDFWYRTTSPHYYDIAGIKLGERVRGDLTLTDPGFVPQADLENALPDKSSESGQVVVSKSMHYKGLLLALYYNLHGYNAYYPLLTQGNVGEGDKETFLAGALALKEQVYQVKTDCAPAGYSHPEEGYRGTGIRQILPIDDYEYHVTKTRKDRPRTLFLHFNIYKLNARDLLEGDRFKDDASRVRLMGRPSENVDWMEYQDLELQLWMEAKWSVCHMPRDFGVVFKDWAKANMTELCEKVTAHIVWLEKTSKTCEICEVSG